MVDLTLLNTAVNDEGVAQLEQLKDLRSLSFQGSAESTNDAMDVVSRMTNLVYFSAPYTRVSDPGVAKLTTLKKLRLLDLRGWPYHRLDQSAPARLGPLLGRRRERYRTKQQARQRRPVATRERPSKRFPNRHCPVSVGA